MTHSLLKPLRPWHIALLIGVLTVAVYLPVLSKEFVSLDDDYLIYDNLAVKEFSLANIRHVFSSYDPQLYIPLTFVSWQLTHLVFGMDAWWFHAVNLLFHAANAVLVYFVLRRLLERLDRGMLVAFFTALLFALHPLQTEAVLWAASRKDLLASCFFLLSMLWYLRYREGEHRRQLFVSMFFFALALLSKVSVVTLPFVLLLVDWWHGRKMHRQLFIEKIPYFALSILFIIIAAFGKTSVIASSGLQTNLLLWSKSVVFYLWKIIWPVNFSIMYPYQGQAGQATFMDPILLLFLLGVIILWCSFLFLLFTRKWKPLGLGLGFYLLLLVPNYTNIWKNGFLFFASDRYAYLAVIGVFLIITLGLSRLMTKRSLMIMPLLLGICLVLLIPLTLIQAKTWKNSEALFQNVVDQYPDLAVAHVNLGMEYIKQKRDEDAMKKFELAAELEPWYTIPLFNMAAMYGANRDIKTAVELLDNAAAVVTTRELSDPAELTRFFWLAERYDQLGQPEKSLKLLEKLVTLVPNFADVHRKLGDAYRVRGRTDDARVKYQKALEINPEDEEARKAIAELSRQ